MLQIPQAHRLMPWAWSAAWLLVAIGVSSSDIYSVPSRSPAAYIVLSTIGWAAAGYVTAMASRGEAGRAAQWAAWAIAGLASTVLGMLWLHSWQVAFLGPIASTGIAGSLGGVASAPRRGAARLGFGALLGLVFFLFAMLSFYAGYFSMIFYMPASRLFGPWGADALIWGVPAALCGLGAGFAARGMLAVKPAHTVGAAA